MQGVLRGLGFRTSVLAGQTMAHLVSLARSTGKSPLLRGAVPVLQLGCLRVPPVEG